MTRREAGVLARLLLTRRDLLLAHRDAIREGLESGDYLARDADTQLALIKSEHEYLTDVAGAVVDLVDMAEAERMFAAAERRVGISSDATR